MPKLNLIHITTDLEQYLQDLDDKMIGKEVTLKDIAVAIAYPLSITGISESFVIKFKPDDNVVPGIVNISGAYTGICTIFIEYNPKDENYKFNHVLWAFLKGMIFDTISHETIHIYQQDKRTARSCEFQRIPSKKEFMSIYECVRNTSNEDEYDDALYAVKPDEVDAISYNIASQLFRRYRSIRKSLNALRIGKFEPIEGLDTFVIPFIKKNSHVYKRYMKKIVFYLVNKYSEDTYIMTSECNNDKNNKR